MEKGWVQRRQGVGVLVLMRPFDYPLNAQARFSQNLLDQGSHPAKNCCQYCARPPVTSLTRWGSRKTTLSTCAPCAGSTASRSV
ncbi:hypothetical protein ACLB1R_29790 [Escherichia coli]